MVDKFLKQFNLKCYSRRAHRALLKQQTRLDLGSNVHTITPVVLTGGQMTHPLCWDAATLVQWSESSVPLL